MAKYSYAPYRFAVEGNRALLSSDCGDLVAISLREFDALIETPEALSLHTIQDLLAHNILTCNEHLDDHLAALAARYRTKKAHLLRESSLHMVVPTNVCNCRCRYCQVAGSSDSDNAEFMTRGTADRIVKIINDFPGTVKKIEFQGGEPLLHFEMVRYLTEELRASATSNNPCTFEFVLCTNLQALDHEHLAFLKRHEVSISTSLDGPRDLHNALRPTKDGGCGYDRFKERLEIAREALGYNRVAALMTVARHSLSRVEEIADTYRDLGFHSICFRKLNRYGRAYRFYGQLGYSDEAYVECYIRGLKRILTINREGYPMVEEFTAMIARRLLTPYGDCHLDMLSPAGGGIAGALYNFDGRVYISDEGRMVGEEGDDKYCLGNVRVDSYTDIFLSEKTRAFAAAGTLECRPGCCDCVFLPFCGLETVERRIDEYGFLNDPPASVERSSCWKYRLFLNVVRLLDDPQTRPILEQWAFV